MELTVMDIIELLILPPGIVLVLVVLGLIWRRLFTGITGSLMITAGLLILAVASLWPVAGWLTETLQKYPPLQEAELKNTTAQAIVILSAGRNQGIEYGHETTDHSTLVRVRYGAWLQQRTGLPVLVTGGVVHDKGLTLAAMMKTVLEEEYKVPVRWVEPASNTTYENALYSARILKDENIDHILLVSHATHLPRSVIIFEQMGLRVTPAPTAFHRASFNPHNPVDYLPNADALDATKDALHEWLGRAWYWIRY